MSEANPMNEEHCTLVATTQGSEQISPLRARRWVQITAVIVVDSRRFYLLSTSLAIFYLPNHRQYKNGPVKLVGSLSLSGKATYQFLEIGRENNWYQGTPAFQFKLGKEVFLLHDLILSDVLNRKDAQKSDILNHELWPAGTVRIYALDSAFEFHNNRVISFSHLNRESHRNPLEISTDGIKWFPMPLNNTDVNELFGSGGTYFDYQSM